MKVTPTGNKPGQQVTAGTSQYPTPALKGAREKAIQMITAPKEAAPTQVPIPVNANNISPEELTTVKPVLQSDNNVAQEETQAPEAPKPPPTQDKEPSNSQLAILARKERAIRAQLQQAKQGYEAEKTQWQQEKSNLEKRLTDLESNTIAKSNLKAEAFEALRRGELSYDEITQEMMNPTDPRLTSTIRLLEKRLAEQDQKLASYEKTTQDASNQQYQAALKQIETDVRNLVKTDTSFEAIRFTRSEKDVVDLIEQTYKEEGYVMSVEEASQEVENYLVEEASKLAKLEKIKNRVSPNPAPTKTEGANQGQKAATNTNKQPQQMKTLTNQNSGSRQIGARERAILAFKGELKS